MDQQPTVADLTFNIDASIVFQLGEDLITNSVQAVSELVKNCYDADATYCLLDIVTTEEAGSISHRYPKANGFISIEDDGHGMTFDTLKRGFLVLSSSLKREMKRLSQKTDLKKRTPLGDKGLGRLSAQRLADNVEIFTTPKDGEFQYYIAFSWNDFSNQTLLNEVKVHYEARPTDGRPGTKLLLTGLKNPDEWTGKDAAEKKKQLALDLSKMISPFKEIEDFCLIAKVNGKDLELTEFAERLRSVAQLRYQLEFDGKTIDYRGKARLDYLVPDNKDDKAMFKELVLSDNGEKLFEFLAKDKAADSYELTRSKDSEWFVEYRRKRAFNDIAGLKTIGKTKANPGPFHGEIDYFDLTLKGSGDAFGLTAELRKSLQGMMGVHVYRDGFAVPVNPDWLGLGKQWTHADSYYTLRPGNTLGYIAISADENKQLVETTSREAFKDDPHFENFVSLMAEFVKFSAEAQEFVRRGWLKFRNKHKKSESGLSEDAEPETVTARAKSKVAKAATVKSTISAAKAAVARDGKAAPITEKAFKEAESFIEEVSNISKDLEIVETQIAMLREQMSQMYETVSLGLTAEAISHEINNISDQLAARNRKVLKHIETKPIRDAVVVSHVEFIGTTVSALRKQLSHLAPSLKFVREKRDSIKLEKFAKELKDFYQARLNASEIQIVILSGDQKGFSVYMNRGKLNQIVDNLVLNSEYWLREDIRTNQLDAGEITIELDRPFIRVWDNGKGFDKSIEKTAFEPFTTMKGAGVAGDVKAQQIG